MKKVYFDPYNLPPIKGDSLLISKEKLRHALLSATCNNYRKCHGIPMYRWRQIWKVKVKE